MNHLSNNAQLLWFKLMDLFNRCGWQEWVQVDTTRLMLMVGVESKTAALRARDELVSRGLLKSQRGKKGCPNRYKMVYFPSDKWTENETEIATENATVIATEIATHNKTKNKTKTKTNEEIYKEVPELSEAWDAFVEMRKKIKKPLTERAETMIWNKLNELAKDNPVKQAEILNQSTMHCWQTVYPLKEEEPPASYDIDEMEKKLLYGEIKYERKEVS